MHASQHGCNCPTVDCCISVSYVSYVYICLHTYLFIYMEVMHACKHEVYWLIWSNFWYLRSSTNNLRRRCVPPLLSLPSLERGLCHLPGWNQAAHCESHNSDVWWHDMIIFKHIQKRSSMYSFHLIYLTSILHHMQLYNINQHNLPAQ